MNQWWLTPVIPAYWVTRHRCFEGDKPTDWADALDRRSGTGDALAQFVTKARDGNI